MVNLPHKGLVMRTFDIFYIFSLKNLSSQQSSAGDLRTHNSQELPYAMQRLSVFDISYHGSTPVRLRYMYWHGNLSKVIRAEGVERVAKNESNVNGWHLAIDTAGKYPELGSRNSLVH